MRFYLLKDAPAHFHRILFADADGLSFLEEVEPATVSEVTTRSTTLSSLIPIMSEKCGGEGEFWDLKTVKKCGDALMSALTNTPSIRENILTEGTGGEVKFYYKVVLYSKEGNAILNPATNVTNLELSVKLMDLNGIVLKAFRGICGDKLKVHLELYFKTMGGCGTRAGLITKGMDIRDKVGRHRDAFCVDPQVQLTDLMTEYWKHSVVRGYFRGEVDANLNVILTVDDDAPVFSEVFKYDSTRRILEGAIATDFEIVASNGVIVKCHKSFLIVNSPVLSTMLQSSMSETITNRMEMPDMSEEGVRALLAFIYCEDLDKPKESLEIAFELLKASHKYEIIRLEQIMLTFLKNKPDIYFSGEFATELFLFVRNIPNGEELKEKAKRIFNMEIPIYNPEYEEFCQNHADAAMELFQAALANLPRS